MTTRTIITGEIVGGTGIRPAHGTTWADLTTWAAYDNWYSTSGTQVEIQLDDDLGSVKTVIPTVNLVVEGTLTLSVKISDTGSFSGEETTINFVEDTAESYVPGRYFRWSITVDADSTYAVPAIRVYQTNYNSVAYTEELHNDLNIYGSEDSENINDITTELGYVLNIQATANQGGLYVVDGYIEDESALYYRTQKTVNQTGTVNIDTVRKKVGTGSFDFDTTNGLQIDMGTDGDFGTGDFTVEAWVYLESALQGSTNVPSICNQFSGGTGFNLRGINSTAHPSNTYLDYDVVLGGVQYGPTSSTINLPNDQWVHIALVKNGTNLLLFKDGVLVDTQTSVSNSYDTPGTDNVRVGDTGGPSTNNWQGSIDELRISNSAIYTSGFTPFTWPLTNLDTTVLLLHADDFTDDAGINYGDDTYIIQQKGGSAQIESKNPPRVRVVDYAGNPWDGSADIVLRGYPKIVLRNNRVSAVA